jgi:hypothetical protein
MVAFVPRPSYSNSAIVFKHERLPQRRAADQAPAMVNVADQITHDLYTIEICIRDFHGGEVIFDSRYLYLFPR